MVIVDGERSSKSLLFWVCGADCQSLAKNGYCCHRNCDSCGLFFLHYHDGGMTPIIVIATAGKGGRGAGSISPPTAVVGGMTPNAVAATARRVAG